MMTEKEMVNDALNNINSALTSYASAISQAENPELRSALIQMRNHAEQSQYELYTLAKNLHYYVPAPPASMQSIQRLREEFANSSCYSSNQPSVKAANYAHHYISSQSNGLLDHMDAQTRHALQAPPRADSNTIHR